MWLRGRRGVYAKVMLVQRKDCIIAHYCVFDPVPAPVVYDPIPDVIANRKFVIGFRWSGPI